ncbi:MAG: hypothetical protein KCHDKBKB_00330 [Elusimicrobia bacterium]|nr:hypothetical protein [Elusimicrobiota bacterium]
MKPKFTPQGESFVIDHYNSAPPFSNFFPALAGLTGKPMWVFFTNRGQGVASFGVNNKDGAMMEFLPANKAYQATPLLGFRTFIKHGSDKIYEPFSVASSHHQTMIIRPYELEIRERNMDLGLEISVVYFGVPNEVCPLLARSLTIKNIGNKGSTFTVVDGCPRVLPFGMNDYLTKNMSRTIEAFAEVLNLKNNVPVFKLKIEPHDRPEIRFLDSGFFSMTLSDGEFLPVIVDPSLVFGTDTSFQVPIDSLDRIKPTSKQLTSNILPSAFLASTASIPGKHEKTWVSYFGLAENVNEANHVAHHIHSKSDYFGTKRSEMRQIYQELVNHFGFDSGNEVLNQYAAVTFMDNVLRGGFPHTFGSNGPTTHVFSRKHGDMERDYNNFQISATAYSQGNGNFRDVNQNRRNDLLLNPKVGTSNIEAFFNLLQLDGYNPLVVNPVKFSVPKDILNRLDLNMTDRARADYVTLIRQPVLIGQIYEFIRKYSADPLNVSNQFRDVMSTSTPHQGVQHGEGFWVDHWMYNLDHLEQYVALFPEKKAWLFYEKNDFTFYDSDHFVRPRREKYVVTSDKKIRQYHAVVESPQKQELIKSRALYPNKVRTEAGQGEILQVNLFTKLLSLAVIKISSLDPFGVGLEMDADKPGWCDALNGLPGLLGSSSHETYELHRLVRFFIHEVLPLSENKAVDIPTELYTFLRDVEDAFDTHQGKDFVPTWDKLATAREEFRSRTFMGVSGKTRNLRIHELRNILLRITAFLSQAEKKALDPKTGIPTSYFYYEVDASDLSEGWRLALSKLSFKQHRVPPFLEGAVHAMKTLKPAESRKLYNAVRKSDLFDSKLGMYRLNVPLQEEPPELGRVKVFSPGWLENESVFLHMHYKYLLEILRAGMTETFFKEINTGWIAFRDPEVYGRSVYENSSFIASSAFPDTSYHGRGFVARLSGATSEFLSMIYLLAFGPTIFKKEEGYVFFSPEPMLPKEWFTKIESGVNPKNSFSVRLFGTPVTYVNDSRKNTFGTGAAKPHEFEWILEGRFYRAQGRHLPADASLSLREGKLEKLTIYLK